MSEAYSPNHGIYYLVLGWVLTGFVAFAIVLRFYTRCLVTKSVGSDDYAIVFALPLTIAGQILDTLAVSNGLGKHQQVLDEYQVSAIIKWEYILWILVFISFFFVRCSVMLFTLRLLPATKVWPARLTVLAFFLNFAITMLAVVTWGIKCVPFAAIYESRPHAWCESSNITIISQRINGALACFIDIVTALVPAFLLWKIQIKKSTKIALDTIFLLGLCTAALSIGRAATFHDNVWQDDVSWRLVEPSMFSLFEEKLGIVFACCPAIRQLAVHITKHGSPLPTHQHQSKHQDFHRMRTKVKYREIFWYRKPDPSTLANYAGAPIYPPEDMIDKDTKHYAEKKAKHSPLDKFGSIFKPSSNQGSFWRLRSTDASSSLPSHSKSGTVIGKPRFNRSQAWPGSSESPERDRIATNYHKWDWPPRSKEDSTGSSPEDKPSEISFLRENSQGSSVEAAVPIHPQNQTSSK